MTDKDNRSRRPEAWTAFLCFEPEVASTQALAGSILATGSPMWKLVLADHQTKGRASEDKGWWSMPGGTSLLLSLVVRSGGRTLNPPVTVAAVVALHQALRALGADSEIAWPTSVLIGGRKVAGVCADAPGRADIVIGVGVNCNQCESDFPDDLRGGATSVREATGEFCDRLSLMSHFLTYFRPLCEALDVGHPDPVLDAYREACRTLGRSVRVTTSGMTVEGVVVDLDSSGCLILDSGEHIGAGVVTELPVESNARASAGIRLRRMRLPLVGACAVSATGLVGSQALRHRAKRRRSRPLVGAASGLHGGTGRFKRS